MKLFGAVDISGILVTGPKGKCYLRLDDMDCWYVMTNKGFELVPDKLSGELEASLDRPIGGRT